MLNNSGLSHVQSKKKSLVISAIVPVFNGGGHIGQCLEALGRSSYPLCEVIVVDDGSTDESAEISRQHHAVVVHMPQRAGPAAARNAGARQARGGILLFVDADVVVRRDTVARVAANFESNPGLAAVFGSYDDKPREQNFLSQYKNIFHHFVHQMANAEAATFWAGCGAMDRQVFEAAGGFDENRYNRPSIEDVELGYRIRSSGHRILLDKELQVQHLKEWRMGSLLRSDILCRAIPWTRLILERRELINDLNLRMSDRFCGGLAALLIVSLIISVVDATFLYLAASLSGAIILLNLSLYRYFFRNKGAAFVSRAFVMHILYYSYSSAVFVACACQEFLLRKSLKPLKPEK